MFVILSSSCAIPRHVTKRDAGDSPASSRRGVSMRLARLLGRILDANHEPLAHHTKRRFELLKLRSVRHRKEPIDLR
jgi:hypothetical protein